MERSEPRRERLRAAAVAVLFLLLVVPAFHGVASPDLAALWGAALAFGDGARGAIYDGSIPFDTLASPAVAEALAADGYADAAFAYLYPPLWAALAAPLAAIAERGAVFAVVGGLNAALLVGLVWLAARATASRVPLPVFLLFGLALIGLTHVGGLALFQNQLQIPVSVLILLAAERTRSGRPVAAGAALALAAALKLFPVLLVAIWIGQRNGRAVLSFAITGAALAGLSVALAGWEMHAAFLDQLGRLSATVVSSQMAVSLPALGANLGPPDWLGGISYSPGLPTALITGEAPGWLPPVLLGLMAGLVLLLLRGPATDGRLWAAGAAGIALLTPVSWIFAYLPLMAMLPALAGRPAGLGFVLFVGAGLSYPATSLVSPTLWLFFPFQVQATLLVLVATIALWPRR